MSVRKIRRSLIVGGTIEGQKTVTADTNLQAKGGTLTLSTDASISRLAAGKSGPVGTQLWDMSGGGAILPSGTAAIGTALLGNGRIRIASQGGTPAIAFEANGTISYILASGQL
jgi:hypothetical protein